MGAPPLNLADDWSGDCFGAIRLHDGAVQCPVVGTIAAGGGWRLGPAAARFRRVEPALVAEGKVSQMPLRAAGLPLHAAGQNA